MRVIALMNQKGGVGKTTTTVNLGAAIAELGQRVLLIDMDPQAHLTINYGVNPTPETITLYNVLVDDTPLLDAMIGLDKNIGLIPSFIDLAASEIELVSVLGRETLLRKRIEAAIADPSGEFDYDYVLLDCPPSLGLLTLNALAVADEVLVPMQPQFLPMQGVAKLFDTVRKVKQRMNPKLRVLGIVLTMFDSQTKLSNEVEAELHGYIESAQGKSLPWSDAKVFKSRIRRNIKLAESPSFGQTIIAYEPNSNGAADYRALAREVLGLPELPPAAPRVRPEPVPAADVSKAATGGAPKSAKAAKTSKPRAPRAPALLGPPSPPRKRRPPSRKRRRRRPGCRCP